MSHKATPQFQDTPPILLILTDHSNEGNIVAERSIQNPNFFLTENHNAEVPSNSNKARKIERLIAKISHGNTISELIELSKSVTFRNAGTITGRLTNLVELYEEEEDLCISIGSLKTMLTFMASLPSVTSSPSLTLNESGTFQAGWRENNKNLITLRFNNDSSLDYVVFQESQRTATPVILNGQMNIFDFADYMQKLELIKLLEG